mmetsp:Transcript_64502/g.185396  ORF Transcript_64502/g.185396 Transcript_64502/m.185396 type:complete len:93 (-) Transcript_64502:643-921(-)
MCSGKGVGAPAALMRGTLGDDDATEEAKTDGAFMLEATEPPETMRPNPVGNAFRMSSSMPFADCRLGIRCGKAGRSLFFAWGEILAEARAFV